MIDIRRKLVTYFVVLISLFIANASSILLAADLEEDAAFQLHAEVLDAKHLELRWNIAPQHYLYKTQLSVIDQSNSQLLYAGILPPGQTIQDEVLGEYVVYSDVLVLTLPWNQSNTVSKLLVRYQGCVKDGFCYLPITKLIEIQGKTVTITNADITEFPAKLNADKLAAMLSDRFLPITLLIFLGLGILLSFTPCVLPMIPIVVNLIIGPKKISSREAFFLSGSYVLGMASCYTIAGVIAGLLGATLQAWLQQPLILITLSIFLVILALNQFELIHVSLPYFNTRIHHWTQRQLQGSYFGAFIVGLLSAMIVSPCITPPLIGALTYISQHGNPAIGGLALFCLGIGMGIPLIVVAMLSSMILPKAGEWMNAVKTFAGLALLGLAIWLIQRIIPEYIATILWGSLCILAAVLFKAFHIPAHTKKATKILKLLGILLAIFGAAIIMHTVYKQINKQIACEESTAIQWQQINTLPELEASLKVAQKAQQYTVLEFYADWCTSCKIIEAKVFTNPEVISELSSMNLLRVDMTNMDAKQKPLLHKYKIYGPPVIIFFNPDGTEITTKRVVGEINAQEMLNLLQAI